MEKLVIVAERTPYYFEFLRRIIQVKEKKPTKFIFLIKILRSNAWPNLKKFTFRIWGVISILKFLD